MGKYTKYIDLIWNNDNRIQHMVQSSMQSKLSIAKTVMLINSKLVGYMYE